MTHSLRIPTKEQYAYIEVQFEGTPEEAVAEYTRLTDLVQGREGSFEKIQTFTGETVLYNAVTHKYTDLEGNALISGSQYKKSLEKPFDLERMAPMIAAKYGVPEAVIREMWKRNSYVSTCLGNSLHSAMEQWFRNRKQGTEKNYHLPKHPFLRNAVESFPLKDVEIAHPEIMVSDVKNKRVGQIDLLVQDGEKKGIIVDYKSDAEVKKNVSGHFNQLSFYAHILMAKGWEIEGLQVWNYTDGWTSYDSPVLALTGPLITKN